MVRLGLERVYDDCFAAAFSIKKNRDAWRKVGAAPLTMACLKNDSVRHDSAGDQKFDAHKAIKAANHLACSFLLSRKGFNGKSLCVDLKEEAVIAKPVTELVQS